MRRRRPGARPPATRPLSAASTGPFRIVGRDALQVDSDVEIRAFRTGEAHARARADVAHRRGEPRVDEVGREANRLDAQLEHAQGHDRGALVGFQDRGPACRLLGVGALRQAVGLDDLLEGRRVLVDGAKQAVLDRLRADGRGRHRLARLRGGARHREVRDHRGERCGKRAREGRDAAAARRRRVARRFVGEAGHREAAQAFFTLAEPVFDDALARIEGLDVVQAERGNRNLHDQRLGQTGRTALSSQVVVPGCEERVSRDEADELAAGDAQAAARRLPPYLLEGLMRRRLLEVHEIDGHLRAPELGNEPADGLRGRQRARRLEGLARLVAQDLSVGPAPGAAGLADVERDVVRELAVARVQVDVVGDEKRARADGRRARPRVEGRRPEVGRPGRVLETGFEAFVLALSHVGEIAPLGPAGGRLVEVDRNAELVADPPSHLTRELDAVVHRGAAANGHEGADVHRAHPRVRAFVTRHVDSRGGDGRRLEGGFGHGLRGADEREHGPVGLATRVHVEQHGAVDRRDRAGQRIEDRLVAALREVRYALDDLHGCLQSPPPRGSRLMSFSMNGTPSVIQAGAGSPLR